MKACVRLLGLVVLLSFAVAIAAQGPVCTASQIATTSYPIAIDDVLYLTSAQMQIPVLNNDNIAPGHDVRITGLAPCASPSGCTSISTPGNGGLPASHGSATIVGNVISYTAPASPVTDSLGRIDSFVYTITDFTLGLTSDAHVNVYPVATLTAACVSLDCVFTVAATTSSVHQFVWSFGDNTGETSAPVTRWNHQYPLGGHYTVFLTIDYYDGSNVTASTSFDVTFRDSTTFQAGSDGLSAFIHNISITPYNLNSQVMVNWSLNPADCVQGCGPGPNFTGAHTCPTTCELNGGYLHPGTYVATFRVVAAAGTTDYPVAFTVTNNAPRPAFIYNRPEANIRSIVFDPWSAEANGPQGTTDDGPAPLDPFEWDFGDGSTVVEHQGGAVQTHNYQLAGTYNVTLKVTDGLGKYGITSRAVTVDNAPPIPRITVTCRSLQCDFNADTSTDDGNNITGWDWTFGNGATASGAHVSYDFTSSVSGAPACFTVSLKTTDAEGGVATALMQLPQNVALGRTGGVTLDSHAESYSANGQWQTSNGNLNAIAEPGETLIAEPNWALTAGSSVTAHTGKVSLVGDPPGASPWNSSVSFVGNTATYASTGGTADCWAGGQCYAVTLAPQLAAVHSGASQRHMDFAVEELDAATNLPTPGSPFLLHLGASFADVSASHWAYRFIESILHTGVNSGCGGANFCPGTVLTRADISQWLLKAKHGSAYQPPSPPSCPSTPPFADVPCSHPLAAWIAQLKTEQVAAGDANGNYAPATALSRADLAVFLLRTRLGGAYVPPPCSPDFGDVSCGTNPAAAWISDVKTRGISAGCGPTVFCPNDPVDRAQAAALVTKTFALSLGTPQCGNGTSDNALDVVPTHPPRDPIQSLTFVPSPVITTGTSTATLTLGDPPATPATIPLSVTLNPSAVSIPSTVVVDGGHTTATFTVTPANLSSRTPTLITASYLNTSKSAALDVCTPAPSVVSPGSVTINAGQSTTLSVSASGGGGPLTYQWYQGAAPSGIQLGTGTSITVSPTTTTSYSVIVNSPCGSTPSATATVTVCNPPVITSQPPSLIISSGKTATLSVTATGSNPLTYQWYEGTSGNDTKPVLGATNSTYTTGGLTVSTSYWVRVKSTCNGPAIKDSNTAAVTVVSQLTRVQMVPVTAESASSITGTWALPTQQGNLLVAVISASNSVAIGDFTPPAGWLLAKSYAWNHINTAIYYLPNCGASRGAEMFSVQNYPALTLLLLEYTWAAAAPFDQTAFEGDTFPRSGTPFVTGYTTATAPLSEVVVSALTTYAQTDFLNPSDSFTRISQQLIGSQLTTAVHERMVTASGNYGHSATGGGAEWVGMVATFKAAPPLPSLVSLSFSPSPVGMGSTSTGTVTLSSPANANATVSLGIDNPAAATVPSSVVVSAGQSTGTFLVTPASVTARTTTNITATYLNVTKTTQLDVCPRGPAITGQPGSSIINAGQPVTLSVIASGGGALTYQWYQGVPSTPNPINLAIGSSLTVTPPLTMSYWVKVTNSCASTSSATATVTVCTPVTIVTPPASQTITTGTSAILSVAATGSATLSYQWYEGPLGITTNQVGTGTSYTTPNLTATKSYWVHVSSSCNGSVADSAATITVVSQITRVQSAGASGQSQVSLTANWPQLTHAGNLLVAVVSASNGSYPVASFTAATGWQLAAWTEWDNLKTAIYYYPNCPGGRSSESFGTGANNYRDLTLQLAEYTGATAAAPLDQSATNGSNAPSGGLVSTGTTLTTSQAKELVVTALTSYSATSFTSPTNSFVKVQEQSVASDLTTALHDRIVSAAGTYGHSATVTGAAQWVGLVATFKAADPSISSLTFSPSPAVIGTSSTGTITLGAPAAAAASLTLSSDNPAAAAVPATVAFSAGQSTGTFQVTPGSVSARTTTNITATYLGVPKTAALDVCPPAPAISTQPGSPVVNAGQPATLSVVASGTGTLMYQWYQGTSLSTATLITGATGASLTVTPVATASYLVKVSNACFSTASSTGTVTVCTPPSIATPPAPQTIVTGTAATLSVAAGGTGPFSYQWYQGTAGTFTMPLATTSTFTTAPLTATTSYWVRITSGCNGGMASSGTVTVTVTTAAPQISRIQTAAGIAQSQTSVTVNWLHPTQAGNFLVAVVSAANNTYPIATFTPPTGWQLASWTEWSNVKTAIYYLPNNGGGRTGETFSVGSVGNFRDLVLQLAEYSGVALASPLDRTATAGDNLPSAGTISSGTTAVTSQSKELVISGLAVYAATPFSSPTNSFLELSDLSVGSDLSAAMHERIVTAPGPYGHSASVSVSAQWIGVIATFKSADSSASAGTQPSALVAGRAPDTPAPDAKRQVPAPSPIAMRTRLK
jgi:hypothetical protein